VIDTSTGPVLAAIEQVWTEHLRPAWPELPGIVLILGPGDGLKWGHFSAARWIRADGRELCEVLIALELTSEPAERCLAVLLHEAAHALAHVRGISDTSRDGRYHNGEFKRLAEEVGLTVEQDDTYGWTIDDLTDATRRRFREAINALRRALGKVDATRRGMGRRGRRGAGADDEAAPATPKRAAVRCRCQRPRSIQVARGVLGLGPILCGVCGMEFA